MARFAIERRPGLFREDSRHSGGGYAFLWPFSRAAAAVLDMVELGAAPSEQADGSLGAGLACYLRNGVMLPAYDSAVRPPLGPGGDRFYDDNAWIGLDLVRQHRVTGQPDALARARRVFEFLVGGWEGDHSVPLPGGVTWVESAANGDRNTVSTAPASQLGYLLCAEEGDGSIREWADRMLGWVHTAMRDPVDGLYWDHVGADGAIERTKWSYNQGNVIGAELAHHILEATARGSSVALGSGPLARAEAVATAALDHYDATPDGWAGQGLAFNAVFVRNLVDLAAETAEWSLQLRCRDAAVRWAEQSWAERAEPSGLARPAPGERRVSLLDQAGLVEAQALAALATGVRPSPVEEPSPGT
ncbi:MAG TPA: glycoside hydrolase family 76 protein [Acidimicrobiales bacterium]